MHKILVTGGLGFIGSNLIKILIKNKYKVLNIDKTSYASSFYNIKTQKFTKGRNLNYDRWYGSIIRTAENHFIMVGGAKIIHHKELTQDRISHIPEILTSNNDGTLSWKILKEGESVELNDIKDEGWSYPKFFLSSDGNPFGISYNKLWVMDKENNYRISKVGEIIDLGVNYEIIKKSGSWFSYGETKLGQGRDAVKTLFEDNPELMEELEIKIMDTVKAVE